MWIAVDSERVRNIAPPFCELSADIPVKLLDVKLRKKETRVAPTWTGLMNAGPLWNDPLSAVRKIYSNVELWIVILGGPCGIYGVIQKYRCGKIKKEREKE